MQTPGVEKCIPKTSLLMKPSLTKLKIQTKLTGRLAHRVKLRTNMRVDCDAEQRNTQTLNTRGKRGNKDQEGNTAGLNQMRMGKKQNTT